MYVISLVATCRALKLLMTIFDKTNEMYIQDIVQKSNLHCYFLIHPKFDQMLMFSKVLCEPKVFPSNYMRQGSHISHQ